MLIENSIYILQINDNNGSLESFISEGREFISQDASKRPVFTIRLRNINGKCIDLNAFDAGYTSIECENGSDSTSVIMRYKNFSDISASVDIQIICPCDEPFTYWNLWVEYENGYYIDWIDFPDVIVPDDLIASGGDSRILWPAMEGCLVEDANLRDQSWFKYSPVSYPSKGWEGYYPGPCQTQFMAYYNNNNGLYFGAHDEEFNVKAVEYYKSGDGIRLEFRLFPGVDGTGHYRMNYNMVLGVFKGDWHDAAEIYREWYENSSIEKPPKLDENVLLPEWINESPVVVIYPVRGEKDTGDMSTNGYFPYENAIPHINALSKDFDSKVLALLMHWEGTAPWAPPYVWPPLGGEKLFSDFIEKLHEEGNFAGVYCSGIGWTNKSMLIQEYNREEQFDAQNLSEIMCASPDGQLPYSLICYGTIRVGYDMCPSNKLTKKIVVEEISKIIDSGCDYIQFFDQNLGGASYFCYSKKHGHPPSPGKWQVKAMNDIFKSIYEMIISKNKNVVIGCEAAAAEPYLPYLLFNDLRYGINLFYAKPVPLYSYLFHQYANNFMGNQNTMSSAIDIEKSPENALLRIAYSFISGDMLTVVLRDQGRINWDWGTDWSVEEPEQNSIKMLIRNCNAWRKKNALPFLCLGKMVKPHDITGTYQYKMIRKNGSVLEYPSLLTSRWISPDGRNAQVIVNYTKQKQDYCINLSNTIYDEIIVYNYPDMDGIRFSEWDNDMLSFDIEPLSTNMIEFI